jgi:hypothetical protein
MRTSFYGRSAPVSVARTATRRASVAARDSPRASLHQSAHSGDSLSEPRPVRERIPATPPTRGSSSAPTSVSSPSCAHVSQPPTRCPTVLAAGGTRPARSRRRLGASCGGGGLQAAASGMRSKRPRRSFKYRAFPCLGTQQRFASAAFSLCSRSQRIGSGAHRSRSIDENDTIINSHHVYLL